MLPDIQGLLDVVKANEETKQEALEHIKRNLPFRHFDMHEFLDECQTHCCGIGNFCIKNPHDILKLRQISDGRFFPLFIESDIKQGNAFEDIMIRFKLSSLEAAYLFDSHYVKFIQHPHKHSRKGSFYKTRNNQAKSNDIDEFISRL